MHARVAPSRWRQRAMSVLTIALMFISGSWLNSASAQTSGTEPQATYNIFLPVVTRNIGAWRPFSASSPWNTPIPANPELDPNSAAMMRFLSMRTATHDPRPWININGGAVPVWIADSSAPRYNVNCGSPSCTFFQNVPIPSNAVPDPLTDGHMMVMDATRETAWDFYHARKNSDGSWSADWGAKVNLRGNGITDKTPESGARGSGFPLAAGLIYADEIKAGRINHALVFAISLATPSCWVYPATSGGGTSTDPNALPYGARVQLDPTLDLDTLGLSPAAKIIARALQEYGAFVGDQGGGGIIFITESFYGKPIDYWSGVLAQNALVNLPADRFRVLKMGGWTCY